MLFIQQEPGTRGRSERISNRRNYADNNISIYSQRAVCLEKGDSGHSLRLRPPETAPRSPSPLSARGPCDRADVPHPRGPLSTALPPAAPAGSSAVAHGGASARLRMEKGPLSATSRLSIQQLFLFSRMNQKGGPFSAAAIL